MPVPTPSEYCQSEPTANPTGATLITPAAPVPNPPPAIAPGSAHSAPPIPPQVAFPPEIPPALAALAASPAAACTAAGTPPGTLPTDGGPPAPDLTGPNVLTLVRYVSDVNGPAIRPVNEDDLSLLFLAPHPFP